MGLLVLLALLAATATAAAPGAIRVRAGDTLSHLALRHHTTVAELKRLNALRSDVIVLGELLRLPGTGQARPGARPRVIAQAYTVKAGDNLTVLARQWRTTVPALVQRNQLRRTTIVIGQRLVHDVQAPARRTPAATATARTTVSASAAQHRAVLRNAAVPSRTAVRDLIRRAAKRHGVPTSLALALA